MLYSFTVGERGLYHGSRKYLAESIDVGLRTLQTALKELFTRGLIEKCESDDGKYKGIRCVSRIEMPGNKGVRTVIGEKQREFLADLNRRIEERKAEELKKANEEKERKEREARETLARVDELCARINAKIDAEKTKAESIALLQEKKNAESIAELAEESKSNEDMAKDILIEKMLKPNASDHEKNTIIMMGKYEKPGDNRRFLSFGKSGGVIMTEPQYRILLSMLPTEELMPYFVKLEAMLEENVKTGKKPPHSHYRTIKKWIEEDTAI